MRLSASVRPASGDPEELRGVLHHGRVDVVTTATLLARLLEDPPEPVSTGEDGLVAGEVRLGGEGVHRLGERRAREQLEGDARDARRREACDGLRLLEGTEEPDEHRACRQDGVVRTMDHDHDIGAPHRRPIDHLRAGLGEGIVGIAGRNPGTSLDRDGVTHGDELADRVGSQGNPMLSGRALDRKSTRLNSSYSSVSRMPSSA